MFLGSGVESPPLFWSQQQHNNQPLTVRSVGDIGILITIYDIYYSIMCYYDDISGS